MTQFTLSQLPVDLQVQVTYNELATGETLFHEGDPAQAIFVVETGQVQLLHYTESGQVVSHYSVQAGDFFAEVALFSDIYICTAIATQPTRVIVIPKESFLLGLRRSPDLAILFISQLVHHLHHSNLLLVLRGIRSARDRILHYLRMLTQANRNTVHLEYPLLSGGEKS
jgi:CRP/FNR family transcriptional regulator, dissimilatory nitrate respiration regulator